MAAARPVVGGDDEEFAGVVAAVTLLGSIGLLLYPILANVIPPSSYGLLSGLTLHAVPQAVGAGFAGGAAAGAIATLAKLSRVATLPFLLVVAGANRRSIRFPPEVLGFFVAILLANTVMEGQAARLGDAAGACLLLSFAALGLQTKLRLRAGNALLWAFLAWTASIAAVGTVLYFMGPSLVP